MESKQPGAGDPIEARCTKCRTITNHIIIAMKDDKPARVECNTCKGQHLYRKPKSAPQTAATKAANAKRAERKQWVDLQEQIEGQAALNYAMDTKYKADSVIKHQQFGLGLVLRFMGERKMEVLFEDGLKTMRCK